MGEWRVPGSGAHVFRGEGLGKNKTLQRYRKKISCWRLKQIECVEHAVSRETSQKNEKIEAAAPFGRPTADPTNSARDYATTTKPGPTCANARWALARPCANGRWALARPLCQRPRGVGTTLCQRPRGVGTGVFTTRYTKHKPACVGTALAQRWRSVGAAAARRRSGGTAAAQRRLFLLLVLRRHRAAFMISLFSLRWLFFLLLVALSQGLYL